MHDIRNKCLAIVVGFVLPAMLAACGSLKGDGPVTTDVAAPTEWQTPATVGAVHYASHTTWASKEAFEAWMHSDHFVQAHRGDPLPKGMVLSHPRLQCFEVVLEN